MKLLDEALVGMFLAQVLLRRPKLCERRVPKMSIAGEQLFLPAAKNSIRYFIVYEIYRHNKVSLALSIGERDDDVGCEVFEKEVWCIGRHLGGNLGGFFLPFQCRGGQSGRG
ncbi:hypothetical protein X772_34790 [Mesorhizobium sp. LSJC280B00]|nr:hypothetical protein X772_34790 [Mesorhizobium sp. LSJC280B00]